MSLKNLCFLCLRNSKQLQSVECKGTNGFAIKQNIELFLPGQMKFESNIQPLVCFSCSDVLTTIVTFSIFCTNNIKQYIDYANKLALSNNIKIKEQNTKTEYSRKLRSNKKCIKPIFQKNNVSCPLKLKKDFYSKIKSEENNLKSIIKSDDNNKKDSVGRKRKRYYCTFCTKIVTNIKNHLVKFHGDKKELKKILVYPEDSKERNKLMQNFIKTRIKEFDANKITETIDYGVDSSASDVVKFHIFPVLKDDEITDYIRYDKIIIRYANKLAEKLNSKSSHVTIRARLRLLGHFILKLKKVDPRISCFESILDTQNLKTAINIALDESKNSPNCIYHMNLILKQILLFLTVDYFKARDKRFNRAKEFFYLLKKSYTDKYKAKKLE